jgi:hypothetical protein
MHQCAVRRRPSWSVRINTSPGTRSIQRTEQRTCAGRHTRGHRRIFSAGASSSLTRRDFHGEGFFFSKFTRHGIIESLIGAPREKHDRPPLTHETVSWIDSKTPEPRPNKMSLIGTCGTKNEISFQNSATDQTCVRD